MAFQVHPAPVQIGNQYRLLELRLRLRQFGANLGWVLTTQNPKKALMKPVAVQLRSPAPTAAHLQNAVKMKSLLISKHACSRLRWKLHVCEKIIMSFVVCHTCHAIFSNVLVIIVAALSKTEEQY